MSTDALLIMVAVVQTCFGYYLGMIIERRRWLKTWRQIREGAGWKWEDEQ